MKHIFLLDPLERLNIKKDSTLMMALTFQQLGKEVFLIFPQDFYITNQSNDHYSVYRFSGKFYDQSYYLEELKLEAKERIGISPGDYFHMRLDPPFDSRYLRSLWMIQHLSGIGVKVVNSPEGILLHNEKLYAYQAAPEKIPSYIGQSFAEFLNFITNLDLKKGDSLILKPLDLFQGMGVERVDYDPSETAKLEKIFQAKLAEFSGMLIAQPFLKSVYQGEVRSLFFNGKEIGTILKVPAQGSYMANIAQGAQYHSIPLDEKLKKGCQKVSNDLLKYGVLLIAFDILGGHISEVNITCPGLLVEVSTAVKKNLAEVILNDLERMKT